MKKWFFMERETDMQDINFFIKRLVDICGSSIGLVVLSPLFVIVAIAIKITSKGPVFFKQERIGRYGRKFNILKFRTMVTNAEHIGEGLRITSEHDFRITKIGRVLRATSLDELPQLVNVLRGMMSLVGPRPPVIYYPYKGYESYPGWAKKRFQMRPGITGLAQVTVRASVSWDERMVCDVKYVEKFSIFLDAKILLTTFLKVFKKENIYLYSPIENDANLQQGTTVKKK